MKEVLRKKLWEAVAAAAPIVGLAFLVHFTLAPMPGAAMALFGLCAALLAVGMALFTLGAEMAMIPMGEMVGAYMTRTKSLRFICAAGLAMGFLVTAAEPDLQVLAQTVPAFPTRALIYSVAAGVGAFMVTALLRIVFQVPLNRLLAGLYALVFLLALFVKPDFLPVAFDSGGVTTGPITVPFILALGIGVSAVRGGRSAEQDSFGLVALCSVGPVLAVMVLSLFYSPHAASYASDAAQLAQNLSDIPALLGRGFSACARDVLTALLPIVAFFTAFQLFFLKLPRGQLIRIGVGLLYTAAGLILFLSAVNAGFMAVGYAMGKALASLRFRWIIVPVGALIGFFIVRAEPAVHVLTSQVEEITDGSIGRRAMMRALSIGIAFSVSVAMARVLTGAPILAFVLPGYALAVALSFFVPGVFNAIAFDSGGVASGPMTATFLLPFAMGACDAAGGSVLSDAFGIVAMVAMTPLIAVQGMAFLYARKTKKSRPAESGGEGEDIIDFE